MRTQDPTTLLTEWREGNRAALDHLFALVYQDLDALKAALRAVNPAISQYETSCFDGHYITGDVTPAYLEGVELARSKPTRPSQDDEGGQLDLNLVT